MATPVSNTTPLCAQSLITNYADARAWGDLVNDDGTRASSTSILTNTIIADALMGATGEIEAAVIRGERYTPADLATIEAQNSGTSGSAAFLRKLCAWLAFGALWTRRRPSEAMPPLVVWAYSVLESLGKGEKLLSTQEVMDADIPDSDFETAGDTWNNIPLATSVSWRYYGTRSKYYRPYYGGGAAGYVD